MKRPPGLILSDSGAWFEINNTGELKKVIATISSGGNEIGKAFAFASYNAGIQPDQNRAFFELSDFFKPYVKPEYTGPGSPIKTINSDVVKSFTITFECTNETTSTISADIKVLYADT